MAHFVLDSYALLAYFRHEEGAEKIAQLLNETATGKHELHMSCINAGEVYYMSYRKDGAEKASLVWKALQEFPIHIHEVDLSFTFKVAQIKAKYKLSYADAFAAVLTITKKATLITGDDEFENMAGETNFKVNYL